MHYLSFNIKQLRNFLFWFFCLFIPGGALVLINNRKWAFAIPLLGLLWVLIFSWSRWVITPIGFGLMLTGLVILHLGSYLYALIRFSKTTSKTEQPIPLFILLLIMNAAIVISSHSYKADWYGFALYHIPSESMSPTLKPGDIVFIDTWVYKSKPPQKNDILVLKRNEKSFVLAKRLTNIRTRENITELYIEGDNKNRSVDSRRFGWVSDKYLIGKIEFIWFSFRDFNRYSRKIN